MQEPERISVISLSRGRLVPPFQRPAAARVPLPSAGLCFMTVPRARNELHREGNKLISADQNICSSSTFRFTAKIESTAA